MLASLVLQRCSSNTLYVYRVPVTIASTPLQLLPVPAGMLSRPNTSYSETSAVPPMTAGGNLSTVSSSNLVLSHPHPEPIANNNPASLSTYTPQILTKINVPAPLLLQSTTGSNDIELSSSSVVWAKTLKIAN